MGDQAALDLDRRAPDAADLQHIVAAAVVDEEAVGILAIGVTGVEPALDHCLGGLLGLVPVVLGRRFRADPQPPAGAPRHRLAVLVDDLDLIARHRLAAGAWLVVVEPVADEDVQALGRADAVQDHRARLLLPAAKDVRGQGFGRRDTGADAGKVAWLLLQRRKLRGVKGRCAEIERRLERLDDLEGRVGRGPAVIEHGRAAGPQGKGHGVAETIGEEELAGGITHVVFAHPQCPHAIALAGHHHVALQVHGALGPAGRAGGVQPETVVGRRGEPSVQLVGGPRQLGQEGVDGACLDSDLLHRRLDLGGELGGIDHEPAARILEQVGVVSDAQHGVERRRNDARLDGSPEEIEEGRAVLDDHQHAVAGLEPSGKQRVAGAVHALGEVIIGDGLGCRADGDLGAAAFFDVPVDERHGDVEAGGQPHLEVRPKFNALDHADPIPPAFRLSSSLFA